jgi:aminopeptidase N
MICRSGRRTREIYQQLVSSFDDVNEKVIFNIALAFNQEYQAISNGMLADKTTKGNMFLWQYHMQNP